MRFAAVVVRFLPMLLGYLLAECSGEALFLLSAKHRNIVGDNVKHVLGVEPDKRKLRRTVRSVFKNMAKNYFDLTKLSQVRLDNLEGRVTIEGWHNLTKAITDASGTIIATASTIGKCSSHDVWRTFSILQQPRYRLLSLNQG
jgi:lauroyl/myristoyl acyltransferase